jgi:hypothetical protein
MRQYGLLVANRAKLGSKDEMDSSVKATATGMTRFLPRGEEGRVVCLCDVIRIVPKSAVHQKGWSRMLCVRGLGEPIRQAYERSGLSKAEFARTLGCGLDCLEEILMGGDGSGVTASLGGSFGSDDLTIHVEEAAQQASVRRRTSRVVELQIQALNLIFNKGLIKGLGVLEVVFDVFNQIAEMVKLDEQESAQPALAFRKKGEAVRMSEETVREMVRRAAKRRGSQELF